MPETAFCSMCTGTGECPDCDGLGKQAGWEPSGSFDLEGQTFVVSNARYVPCDTCKGTGKCHIDCDDGRARPEWRG